MISIAPFRLSQEVYGWSSLPRVYAALSVQNSAGQPHLWVRTPNRYDTIERRTQCHCGGHEHPGDAWAYLGVCEGQHYYVEITDL